MKYLIRKLSLPHFYNNQKAFKNTVEDSPGVYFIYLSLHYNRIGYAVSATCAIARGGNDRKSDNQDTLSKDFQNFLYSGT